MGTQMGHAWTLRWGRNGHIDRTCLDTQDRQTVPDNICGGGHGYIDGHIGQEWAYRRDMFGHTGQTHRWDVLEDTGQKHTMQKWKYIWDRHGHTDRAGMGTQKRQACTCAGTPTTSADVCTWRQTEEVPTLLHVFSAIPSEH